jgi:NAD(P)-dependent dehydrogenase (short-subunit alcohol dehydrogenase family)
MWPRQQGVKLTMKRLQDRVILVAGAGAIGNELARRYASEGASVALGDIDLNGASKTVDEISREGGRAVAVHLDGANETSIEAALGVCRESFGGLDGLHVNFADFEDNVADIGVLELSLEKFDRLMQVNMRGHFLCTRYALPEIIARGGGAILYTSSIAAYIAGKQRVGYAMAKSAVLALMRHVASRHGPDGVRANAIAPGFIKRPDQDDVFTPEVIDRAAGMAMIKSRIGEPRDIASLSALLMSDEGSYITGQTIAVDGGVTFRP